MAPRPPSGGLTLCADGTYSQSTGSGTCSWHGGIAGNNNPSSNSGTTSGGGGTGRIVPGTGPATPVETRTLPLPSRQQNPASRAVSEFFDNGGIVYLLIGWWVIAKLRKSRREDSHNRPAVRASTTTTPPPSPKASTAAARPPAKPVSANGAAKPASISNAAQALSSSSSCSCGGREVVRRNRKTGQRFYGCSRYPSCRRTRPLR